MKNIYSVVRISTLVALLFFMPVYPQSIQEWVSANKGIVTGSSIVVGTVLTYCVYRGVSNFMKCSHDKQINQIQPVIEPVRTIMNQDPADIDSNTVMVDPIKIITDEDVEGCDQEQAIIDGNDDIQQLNQDQDILDANNDEIDANHWVVDEASEAFVDQENRDAIVNKRANFVTLNGQNINEILQPGQCLIYSPEERTQSLVFQMKNGNVEIGSFIFEDSSLIQEEFNCLNEHKSQLTQVHSGQTTHISAGDSIKYNGVYMSAKEAIVLQSKTSVDISNGLLISPKIELIGNKIEFNSCYIDTDELLIKSNSTESYCELIRVVFDKNSEIPAGLQGCIDFANNETSDDYPLIILGVKRIEIQFAAHAF